MFVATVCNLLLSSFALAAAKSPIPVIDPPQVNAHPIERDLRNLRIVTIVRNPDGDVIDAHAFEYDEKGRLLLAVRRFEERYRYGNPAFPEQWSERQVRWTDTEFTQTWQLDEGGWPVAVKITSLPSAIRRTYKWRRDTPVSIGQNKQELTLKSNKQGEVVSAEWVNYRGTSSEQILEYRFEHNNGRLVRREVFNATKDIEHDIERAEYLPDGRLRLLWSSGEYTRYGKSLGYSQYGKVRQFDWDGPRIVRERRGHSYDEATRQFTLTDDLHFSYDAEGRLERRQESSIVDWRYHWSQAVHPLYGEHVLMQATDEVSHLSMERRYFRVPAEHRGRGRDDFLGASESDDVFAKRIHLNNARSPRDCVARIQGFNDDERDTFYYEDVVRAGTGLAVCSPPAVNSETQVAVVETLPDAADARATVHFSAKEHAGFRERLYKSVPYAAYRICIVDAPQRIGAYIDRAAAEPDADLRYGLDRRIPGLLREWANGCGGSYDAVEYQPLCEQQQGQPDTHNFLCASMEGDGVLYHSSVSGFMLTRGDVRRIAFYLRGSPVPGESPHFRQALTATPEMQVGVPVQSSDLLELRTPEFQTATRVDDALVVLQVEGDKLVLTVTLDRAELNNEGPELLILPRGSKLEDSWALDNGLPLASPQRDVVARAATGDYWISNTIVERKRPVPGPEGELPVDKALYVRLNTGGAYFDNRASHILVPLDSDAIWNHLIAESSFGETGRATLAAATPAERPAMQTAMRAGYVATPPSACGREPNYAFAFINKQMPGDQYDRTRSGLSQVAIWVQCLAGELAQLEQALAMNRGEYAQSGPDQPAFWSGLHLTEQLRRVAPVQAYRERSLADQLVALKEADDNIEQRQVLAERAARREERRLARLEAENAPPSPKELWERAQGPEGYQDCLARAISAAASGACRDEYLRKINASAAAADRAAANRVARNSSTSSGRNTSSSNSAGGGSGSGNSAVLCTSTGDPDTDTCMSREAREQALERREREKNREKLRQWFLAEKRKCFGQNGHGQSCAHSGEAVTDAADVPGMLPGRLEYARRDAGKLSGFSGFDTASLPGDCPAYEDNGDTVTAWSQTAIVKYEPRCITNHEGDQAAVSCTAIVRWECEATVSSKPASGQR